MIILDTNVLSAIIAPIPVKAVTDWLDRQSETELYLTAVTIFEMRLGIDSLPDGRRRKTLDLVFEDAIVTILGGRVMAFDWNAATEAARLAAKRRKAGRSGDTHDTRIAGIAISRNASIATRNVRHFSDAGVPVINPWTE